MNGTRRRDFLKRAGISLVGMETSLRGKAAAPDTAEMRAGPSEAHGSRDPWVEVSLKNIGFNIGQLRKKVNGRPILAVLKCNAYGHGLIGVAKYLESLPVYGFAVGKLGEAVALRTAGIRLPVLNLGPFSDLDAEMIVRHGISQTVYTDEVLSLVEWAKRLGVPALVHIEVDTGLGRVGVPHDVALAYIRNVARLPHLQVEGVFQSFSEDPEFDRVQLRRFLAVTASAEKEGLSLGLRHVSASTAIFRYGEDFFLDMVRPGISIYGHYPTAEEYELKRMELRPALSLKARAAYVKDIRPGDSLSYFRKFVARKTERVVTAALGYSDGVPQALAGRGQALIRGKRCPFIAEVTASHSYLLATGLPDAAAGDEIVLVGKEGDAEVSLWDLAQAVEVADYKILIGLNPSLRRVYSD